MCVKSITMMTFEFCFHLHAENFHLSYTNYSTIYLRIGQMLSIEVSYSLSSPCSLSDLSSLAPSLATRLILSLLFSLSSSLFLSPPSPSSLSPLFSPSSFYICLMNDAQYCYIYTGCCEGMSRQSAVKFQHHKRYITHLFPWLQLVTCKKN